MTKHLDEKTTIRTRIEWRRRFAMWLKMNFQAGITGLVPFVFGVVCIANAQVDILNTTTSAALYRSESNTGVWTKILVPQTEPQNFRAPESHVGSIITALVVDPKNAKILYANVVLRTQTGSGAAFILRGRGAILKSKDRGKTWEMSTPLGDRTYTVLAVDPSDPSNLYTSTGGTLFRSTDAGRSWNSISNIPLGSVKVVAIDPTDGSTVYVMNQSGIFKTSKGGKNWTAIIPADVGALSSLAIDPRDPKTLYAGTERGVLKSSDSGQRWIGVSTGLDQASVAGIAIDPSNSSVLFAAVTASGKAAVYKSTDSGATWAVSNSKMDALVPRGIAVARTNPSTVYVWGEHSMGFESVNAGATWTSLSSQNSTATDVSALAIDSRTPTEVYIATRTQSPAEGQANPR